MASAQENEKKKESPCVDYFLLGNAIPSLFESVPFFLRSDRPPTSSLTKQYLQNILDANSKHARLASPYEASLPATCEGHVCIFTERVLLKETELVDVRPCAGEVVSPAVPDEVASVEINLALLGQRDNGSIFCHSFSQTPVLCFQGVDELGQNIWAKVSSTYYSELFSLQAFSQFLERTFVNSDDLQRREKVQQALFSSIIVVSLCSFPESPSSSISPLHLSRWMIFQPKNAVLRFQSFAYGKLYPFFRCVDMAATFPEQSMKRCRCCHAGDHVFAHNLCARCYGSLKDQHVSPFIAKYHVHPSQSDASSKEVDPAVSKALFDGQWKALNDLAFVPKFRKFVGEWIYSEYESVVKEVVAGTFLWDHERTPCRFLRILFLHEVYLVVDSKHQKYVPCQFNMECFMYHTVKNCVEVQNKNYPFPTLDLSCSRIFHLDVKNSNPCTACRSMISARVADLSNVLKKGPRKSKPSKDPKNSNSSSSSSSSSRPSLSPNNVDFASMSLPLLPEDAPGDLMFINEPSLIDEVILSGGGAGSLLSDFSDLGIMEDNASLEDHAMLQNPVVEEPSLLPVCSALSELFSTSSFQNFAMRNRAGDRDLRAAEDPSSNKH